MEFLSNTHDPKDPNAPKYVICRFGETPAEAWQHYQDWLRGKVIGRPQAMPSYTVEQLEEMGLVGVYAA